MSLLPLTRGWFWSTASGHGPHFTLDSMWLSEALTEIQDFVTVFTDTLAAVVSPHGLPHLLLLLSVLDATLAGWQGGVCSGLQG